MFDYYLKKDTEGEMDDYLLSVGVLEETDEGLVPSEGITLDRVGTITKVIGMDGEEPILKTYEGYHVNIRSVQEIAEFTGLPKPNTPFRIFGD